MAYVEEQKVSTKQFLQNTFNFFKLISKEWRLLMIGLVGGGIISNVQDYFTENEKSYRASMVFQLEIENGGNAGGLGGFASLMGVGGAAGGGNLFSGANFPAMVHSQKVLEKTLLKTVEVNGKEQLMVNYFLDSSDIAQKEWAGNLFREPFNDAINHRFSQTDPYKFTELETLMMRDIMNKLRGNTTIDPQPESSLIVISSVMSNELLVKTWVETLMIAIEDFYTEVKTQKTRKLLTVQQKRLDSLASKLSATDQRLSRLQFEQQNIIDPMMGMRQAQTTRQNTFLNQQYITQLATIEELNKVILEQTPIFLITEEPRLPLETGYKPTGLNLKLSSLAGLLLMVIFVTVKWSYEEIMNTP